MPLHSAIAVPERIAQAPVSSKLQVTQKPNIDLSRSLINPTSNTQTEKIFTSKRNNSQPKITLGGLGAAYTNIESLSSEATSFKADLVRSPRSYQAKTLSEGAAIDFSPLAMLPLKGGASTEQPDISPFLIAESAPVQQISQDPELGELRLQPLPSSPFQNQVVPDSSTPNEPSNSTLCEDGRPPDPELGCIRLWSPPPAVPARQPTVYLLARFDYFRSSNIYSALDPIYDGLGRPGITLYAAPRLGPYTFLTASVTGNLVRYNTQTQINYNELVFEAGIFQVLSPTMYGRFGWINQRLFIASNDIFGVPKGSRFLDDHAIRLDLNRRDQITSRLYLNTFYQLRAGFAKPEDRSRVINSLIASLNYDIQPVLQVGLDYQFALATFTRQSREDQFQQVGAHLSYTMFRNTQLYLFVGYSFGRSSDPFVDFNGLVFGVSLNTTFGLF